MVTLTEQQKRYLGIGIGIVVVIIIILLILKFTKKNDDSDVETLTQGHLILKREDKEDIDFTDAVQSIKGDDRSMPKMSNVKRACEYIISTGSKIPPQYKNVTDEILTLTSNCESVDCVGQWDSWVECAANTCSNTTRTFNVSTKGNYLGNVCTNKNGDKELKKCNVDKCKYIEIPYARPKSNVTLIKAETGDCKANCLSIDNCQFYILSNTNMCEYHSIPENLSSIDFEYDSNVNVFYFEHNKDKIVKPTNYPENVTNQITVETAVPISSNVTSDQKTYELLEGYAIYNYDLEEMSELTPEECQTKCGENEKCNFAVYDKNGNMCYLKSVIDENVTAFKHPTKDIYTVRIVSPTSNTNTE